MPLNYAVNDVVPLVPCRPTHADIPVTAEEEEAWQELAERQQVGATPHAARGRSCEMISSKKTRTTSLLRSVVVRRARPRHPLAVRLYQGRQDRSEWRLLTTSHHNQGVINDHARQEIQR
jgi:hypothetical protein